MGTRAAGECYHSFFEFFQTFMSFFEFSQTFTKLEAVSSKLGLKINTDKTKTIKINSNAREQIMINNLGIEDVTSFTYLGSVINITGGTDFNRLWLPCWLTKLQRAACSGPRAQS